MAKLLVKKKGYTTKKGVRVKPTSFKITDRGAKGRGKKIVPPLKKGTLGISFSMPETQRRKILSAKAKNMGEKVMVGKLRAIQVLNKRTNPSVSRKALADSKYIAGSFKGKKKVKYPSGFGKNKR